MIFIDSNDKLNLSNLHDNQKKFIQSDYLHTGIVGGYQSGKSVAAVIKVITKLLINPGVPIAYYLPSFRLFEDMLIPKIEQLFPLVGIPYTHHQTKAKIKTPYGEIWMRSMDDPDSIVSYSVGYSVVDEVDVVHANKRDKAMKRISGRNSFKKNTPNQIDFVSTPEGFVYMYNFFVKKANKNKLLLNLSTLDNEDNLAEGYIQGLREQYDDTQLKAYLGGEFINLSSGRVYYSYNRNKNNSTRQVKEFDKLYVGMDFNVGNMSAIVHVIDEYPIAVDEVTEIHDTEDMCKALRERFPKNRIVIYPDATGKKRTTNTTETDIGILQNAKFIVKAKDSNPAVADRIKNMNRMFCNGKGEIGYYVNANKCPVYVESLERMSYDKHKKPDKSSGFDHSTDAGGYFISFEYPLKKKRKGFWD